MVTTIHQPNTPITECFDDLMLLSHGTIMYMGAWAASVQYFSSLGYRHSSHCSLCMCHTSADTAIPGVGCRDSVIASAVIL